MTWDDDLFDAEIQVERTGLARFTIDDLGALLGISRVAVGRAASRGSILPAAYMESFGWGDQKRSIWTCAQAAEILVERRRRRVQRRKTYGHGTYAGFTRHRREGTPACGPCREARNAYQRELRAARRVAA